MTIALSVLLAGCASPPRAVTTIPGVQVVAIEAHPPQPAQFDTLVLDTWVADGIGGGADVLVWLCTPIDGLCIEGSPPGLAGLPFSFWTRVSRADPRSTTTNGWPLFGGLVPEDAVLPEGFDGGGLLVWALACVPGFCPVMDEIAVDPQPGSEPWMEIAEGLADPARWVTAAPEGYASIAVKRVPLWVPPEGGETTEETELAPNGAPHLNELDVPPSEWPPPVGWPPPVVVLGISEPDGDELESRAFTTSGLISQTFHKDDPTLDTYGPGDKIVVDWRASRPPDGGRPPQLFLVVEDERGATDVWSSDKGPDPCAVPIDVRYTTPSYPGDVLVAMVPAGGVPSQSLAFTVTGDVVGAWKSGLAIGIEMHASETTELLASAQPSIPIVYDDATCTASFDRQLDRNDPLALGNLCAYGGTLVDVETVVTDGNEVVATQTIQAVVQIDPDLECDQ